MSTFPFDRIWVATVTLFSLGINLVLGLCASSVLAIIIAFMSRRAFCFPAPGVILRERNFILHPQNYGTRCPHAICQQQRICQHPVKKQYLTDTPGSKLLCASIIQSFGKDPMENAEFVIGALAVLSVAVNATLWNMECGLFRPCVSLYR